MPNLADCHRKYLHKPLVPGRIYNNDSFFHRISLGSVEVPINKEKPKYGNFCDQNDSFN